MPLSPGDRYGSVAILLHWLIAALILANLVIGFTHEEMSGPDRRFWMGQHFAIGLSVLFLSIARLGWRLVHRFPAPLAEQPRIERALAWIVHRLFYVAMIAQPMIGWMAFSTGRDPSAISMWGLFDVAPLPTGANHDAHEFYEQLHELVAYGMIGLLVLHILGALKHHFFDRDPTLARMIPLLRTLGPRA